MPVQKGIRVMVYRDRVRLETRVVQAAYRLGSIELNIDEGCWEGVRVYDGTWHIRSWRCGSKPLPEPRGEREARLKDAVLYTGVYRGPVYSLEPGELEAMVASAGSAAGCTAEIIVEDVCIKRVIEHPEGSAVHEHCVLEASVSLVGRDLGISDRVALTPQEAKLLPRLVEAMCEKLRVAERSVKRLSPLESGRWSVILAGTAAGALVHELAHALEGDWGPRLPLGTVIAPEEFNMIDDPGFREAPYHHVFDDEGVVAVSRRLVSLGRVAGYLGVRWRGEGGPGSARGLFHPPKAMHTVLRVSPGDWGEREVVEETRRGVLIETVHHASIDESGVITLRPEAAWLIERGEIVGFLKLSRVRLRVSRDLRSIDALGRRLWPRLSSEKGYYQVEYAPTIRLQAYID